MRSNDLDRRISFRIDGLSLEWCSYQYQWRDNARTNCHDGRNGRNLIQSFRNDLSKVRRCMSSSDTHPKLIDEFLFLSLEGFETNLYNDSSDYFTTCCTRQPVRFDHRQRRGENQRNSRGKVRSAREREDRTSRRHRLDNRCVCTSGIWNVTNIYRTCCDHFRQTRFDWIMFSANLPDYARSESREKRSIKSDSSLLLLLLVHSHHPKVKQFHIDRKWWYHPLMHRSFSLMDKPIKFKVNLQFLFHRTMWVQEPIDSANEQCEKCSSSWMHLHH